MVVNLIQDFVAGFAAKRSKPQQNAQLERYCDAGLIIIMLGKKIVKQAFQQEFASRSRWLLQNLVKYAVYYLARLLFLF